MKSKRRNRNKITLLITSVSMLLLTLVILFFNFQLRMLKGDTKNFHISFYDYSITKENPSCRIIIDDSIVYKSEKISEFDAVDIVLKNGKHKIEISDLDNKYYIQDFIYIKNYPENDILSVHFNFSPNFEEYIPIYKKQYFDRFIQRHKEEYDEKDYTPIKNQLDQQINVEFLKSVYKPTEKKFEITFYEGPIYLN